MVLPDVQSSADRRNIPIRRVGVKGIRTPILVKSQSGAQHTVADVEMYVSLPADKKGTHMSRFWTLLGGINKPFAPQMMVRSHAGNACFLKSDGGYTAWPSLSSWKNPLPSPIFRAQWTTTWF